MHSRSFFLLLPLFFFLTVPVLRADDPPPPPIKWGKIDRADLEMKRYAPDTSASALVLCDYGESSINNFLNIDFKRHLRVKILTEKGLEWGTHVVTLYTNRTNGETIDDIEGVTYTLNENGKIEEKEFDDDEVFEEKVDDTHTRYKFTMPGLRPGCIFELRYTITARNLWYVRDWIFQHQEPVLWSEYRLIHPPQIGFTVVTRGYERWAVNKEEDVMQYYSGETAAYLGTSLSHASLYRLAVQNIPALRDEPYITAIQDYVNKAEVQFSGYAVRGSLAVERVMQTWEAFIEDFTKDKPFVRRTTPDSDVKELTQKVTAGAATAEAKARAIYRWVTTSMTWDEKNRSYPSQDLDALLTTKKGSSADINALLLAMLRAAGLSADPVMASTRENGQLQELYPIISQFNSLLVRLNISSEPTFLDATNPLRAYGILPGKLLGVRGIVIASGPVTWVTLKAVKRSMVVAVANMTVDSTGDANGTIEADFREQENTRARTAFFEKKPADAAKSLFRTDNAGLTIDSVVTAQQDSVDRPLRVRAHFSSSAFAQSGADLLYFNPHIINRMTENPFKSPVRKFPVDYGYMREYNSTTNILLPSDYEVKEGLKNIDLSVGGVYYRRRMLVDSLHIQVITKLEINAPQVAAEYYTKLRDLYGAVVTAESEQIVMKKRPLPPAPEPPPAPVPAAKKTPAAKSVKKK